MRKIKKEFIRDRIAQLQNQKLLASPNWTFIVISIQLGIGYLTSSFIYALESKIASIAFATSTAIISLFVINLIVFVGFMIHDINVQQKINQNYELLISKKKSKHQQTL